MPSPDFITQWATAVANEWRELAIGWHIALAVFAVALLAGWRPSNRLLGILLTLPLASVSAVASVSGNYFNAVAFALFAAALLGIALRASKNHVRTSSPGVVAIGALLVMFGWVYPHFLRTASWLDYAYAGPFGLLPCPTLAVLIGVTVTFGSLQSRVWGGLLALAGILYGAIGIFALGVALDYLLFSGAIVLAVDLVLRSPRSVRASREERERTLPGDDLIPSPPGTFNHGITIRASRANTWPWLAQMGAGTRAGWYSYDYLDNGRRASARVIVPALQHLSVGMLFPAGPGVTDGFTLLGYEPERSLILGWLSPDSQPVVTWSFLLDRIDDETTRLVVRARGGSGYQFHGLPWPFAKHVIRVVHFVMQREQLLGIAERAEATERSQRASIGLRRVA